MGELGGGLSGGELFTVVPVLVGVVLAVVVVLVLTRLVRAGVTHRRNAALPERRVAARVVGRRTRTEGGGDRMVRTRSYVTFETVDGERLELQVPEREHGLLAEGDEGQLRHQGTWYRGFERG